MTREIVDEKLQAMEANQAMSEEIKQIDLHMPWFMKPYWGLFIVTLLLLLAYVMWGHLHDDFSYVGCLVVLPIIMFWLGAYATGPLKEASLMVVSIMISSLGSAFSLILFYADSVPTGSAEATYIMASISVVLVLLFISKVLANKNEIDMAVALKNENYISKKRFKAIEKTLQLIRGNRAFGLLIQGGASFLSVAVLLGMSLMLHDVECQKGGNKYRLAIKKTIEDDCYLLDRKTENKPANALNGYDKKAGLAKSKGEAGNIRLGPATYHIWFERGRAEIIYNTKVLEESLLIDDKSVTISRRKEYWYSNLTESYLSEVRADENARTLANIILTVEEYTSREDIGVHLVVEGKSSNEQLGKSSPYANNYQLSASRRRKTLSKVFELLNHRAMNRKTENPGERPDRVCTIPKLSSLSLASSFDSVDCNGKDSMRCLVAEVTVIPTHEPMQGKILKALKTRQDNASNNGRLSSLDYIYFSMYTITTTGYGDLVPITNWAKFVTITANLFEVIYIVILFNVLLNLSGGPARRSLPSRL